MSYHEKHASLAHRQQVTVLHILVPRIAFTDSLATVNKKLLNDSHGVRLCKVCIISQGL